MEDFNLSGNQWAVVCSGDYAKTQQLKWSIFLLNTVSK